ncbi:hypothetical protein CDD83_627 [Cordyceps sp. RAO-2017]|nr:hypothetical protein CDD83_627 [Cordyceps sp. RAO-2017]
MEGIRYDDPFLWDEETVAENLCSLERPCTRDPAALSSRIKEEGMDGQNLLTFDFVCSRPELFESLGIKVGGHKASLARAIVGFRSRSSAFRQWKLEFLNELSGDATASISDSFLPNHSARPAQAADLKAPDTGEERPAWTSVPDAPKRKVEALENPSLSTHDTKPQTSPPVFVQTTPTPGGDAKAHGPTAEEPAKRKRIAPLQISTEPVIDQSRAFALEADPVLRRAMKEEAMMEETMVEGDRPQQQDTFPWENEPAQAYLGDGFLSVTAIKSPDQRVSTQLREDSRSFTTRPLPNRLPVGLRLSVNHTMRQVLAKNSRLEASLRRGIVPMRSLTPTEDDDEVLELFDLPDTLDDDTLREVEAEKEELARAREAKAFVDEARVNTLLLEAAADFKTRWEERKLPKHQRKAHKLWTDATRRGIKTQRIIAARQCAKDYDRRIQKIVAEILGQTWTKESDIRKQARSFEQSVEDKLYSLWLADMLESRIEPPKPDSMPRLRRPAAATRSQSYSDGEVLTSSDEDDFVVADDEDEMQTDGPDPVPRSRATTPFGPSPIKPESPLFVDLTQVETPESMRRHRRHMSPIDLTTPSKLRGRVSYSSLPRDGDDSGLHPAEEADSTNDTFESFEVIGKQPPSHWTKLGDRSRLLICLLWRLPHARRGRIFEAVRNTSGRDLYEQSVKRQLSDPLEDFAQLDQGGPSVMAFDVTRLFLSYVSVKGIRLKRVFRLSAANKKRLNDAQGAPWHDFCAFVKRVAPDFPEDSQILRGDAFDAELAELDDIDDDVPPDSQDTPCKRKNAVKEIVQNKEAVDIREREKRRVEEQEARRLKLRAALDTSGSMPRDKSRLIINEAKQEDQPFIYVNEETGKRIKDHQIEGVRFIWNQVVLDEDARQGCLLAHTMGLGKTMQVITFLVAIQESVASPDPAVRSQIPEDLRQSKTLILCPAGLVDNWMDELLLWAPEGLLGPIRKIESLQAPEVRKMNVDDWARGGGVLVTGYNMLQKVVAGDDEVEAQLIAGPNIVVADEAHVLKNPEARVHQVCARFETKCRIALTGSPLANNVEEYYSMINWVAPNYLGPLGEFKEIYARPIQQGLWGDSERYEKRKALKILQVLKTTVAPKVNRATVNSCLKRDLPPKHEFVISVPPTALQQKLYQLR